MGSLYLMVVCQHYHRHLVNAVAGLSERWPYIVDVPYTRILPLLLCFMFIAYKCIFFMETYRKSCQNQMNVTRFPITKIIPMNLIGR